MINAPKKIISSQVDRNKYNPFSRKYYEELYSRKKMIQIIKK